MYASDETDWSTLMQLYFLNNFQNVYLDLTPMGGWYPTANDIHTEASNWNDELYTNFNAYLSWRIYDPLYYYKLANGMSQHIIVLYVPMITGIPIHYMVFQHYIFLVRVSMEIYHHLDYQYYLINRLFNIFYTCKINRLMGIYLCTYFNIIFRILYL